MAQQNNQENTNYTNNPTEILGERGFLEQTTEQELLRIPIFKENVAMFAILFFGKSNEDLRC